MLIVVLEQPLHLAVLALHQHLVVHADEELGSDGAVPLALAVRHDVYVFRPYDHVDPAARREALGRTVDARELSAVDLDDLLVDHLAGEYVAVSDEVRDESVDRLVVDFLRRALLLDVALVHDDDLVGHRQGLFLVVGDVYEGDAELLLEPDELVLHLLPELEIERAERLVEQQHSRFVHYGPRHGYPLLLTA